MQKSIAAAALSLAVTGCQARGNGAPPPAPEPDDTAYADDIGKLCNAVALSGAEQYPEAERGVPVAMWLGKNLTTPQAHTFLVKIQPMEPNAKADALDAESTRVHLASCPLSALWRAAGATKAP